MTHAKLPLPRQLRKMSGARTFPCDRLLLAIPLWATLFALGSTEPPRAENWPHWRGPFFNGSTSETNLPARFSQTENVLWTARMPGPAAATPIVWGNHVFISSVDREKETLEALCLDRTDGKLLWRHEIASGIRKDDRSNYASDSPATDGQRVCFYYGNGDLAAFGFSGDKLWARNIQKDYGPYAILWTYSSSPTLYHGKLYLQVLQRNVPVNGHGRSHGPNDSYLLALDPKTGRQIWRQIRPADARQESFEAYSTPIPHEHDGRAEILLLGGDCLTGHDPATGHELWRWGTWNPGKITHWRMVVSPVAGDGIVLACAPKGAPVYAVKAGGRGMLDNSALAWVSKERFVSSDVSTPLFYKHRFYVLNSDRRALSCVEPATGRVVWTSSLDSRAKLDASPTGADDKIYMINQRGDVFVVAAGDQFKLLGTASMGDDAESPVRSSIAISDGNLFIRTASKLYCVGKR
jgi:outer membrane protein assembly factor BamB